MIIARDTTELRQVVAQARAGGKRIGFVPTMGALHEGHVSLLRLARERSDFVVASIFVNPTQFGPNEDLARYPRPWERDQEMCRTAGVALLFLPHESTIYPPGARTFVTVEGISERLEGASRPGHFRGVATVVTLLFNLVQPDIACFGQKDGQQVAVIRQLVRDLHLPVEIVIGPTVREPDGLALSSRNVFLDADQRRHATVLFRALEAGRQRVAAGERDLQRLRAELSTMIQATPGAELDYLALVEPNTMDEVATLAGPVMAAVAVRFGGTRLIDNMNYEGPSS